MRDGQYITKEKAVEAFSVSGAPVNQMEASLRYLRCKTDYTVNGYKFKRMEEYPLWVLLPCDGHDPAVLYLLPMHYPGDKQKLVFRAPRQAFFNPFMAPLVSGKNDLIRVLDICGEVSKEVLLPSERFDISAVKTFVRKEFFVRAVNAVPYLFVDGERFFVGVRITSGKPGYKRVYVFDCYTGQLYTYYGWPVKKGGAVRFVRRLQLTREISLNAHRGSVQMYGMWFRYDKRIQRISVHIE